MADTALEIALAVARSFNERTKHDHPLRKAWFERMPGEWPVKVQLTVDDVRKARALLKEFGDG